MNSFLIINIISFIAFNPVFLIVNSIHLIHISIKYSGTSKSLSSLSRNYTAKIKQTSVITIEVTIRIFLIIFISVNFFFFFCFCLSIDYRSSQLHCMTSIAKSLRCFDTFVFERLYLINLNGYTHSCHFATFFYPSLSFLDHYCPFCSYAVGWKQQGCRRIEATSSVPAFGPRFGNKAAAKTSLRPRDQLSSDCVREKSVSLSCEVPFLANIRTTYIRRSNCRCVH